MSESPLDPFAPLPAKAGRCRTNVALIRAIANAWEYLKTERAKEQNIAQNEREAQFFAADRLRWALQELDLDDDIESLPRLDATMGLAVAILKAAARQDRQGTIALLESAAKLGIYDAVITWLEDEAPKALIDAVTSRTDSGEKKAPGNPTPANAVGRSGGPEQPASEQMPVVARAITWMMYRAKETKKLPTMKEICQVIPDANRSRLYRDQSFMAARKACKEIIANGRMRPGFRTSNGDVDAKVEDHEPED